MSEKTWRTVRTVTRKRKHSCALCGLPCIPGDVVADARAVDADGWYRWTAHAGCIDEARRIDPHGDEVSSLVLPSGDESAEWRAWYEARLRVDGEG